MRARQHSSDGNRKIRAAPALFTALFASLCVAPQCVAQSGATLEYEVKAAFLLNFTKFIEWPTAELGTAGSPIPICILGDDPFGATLDQIVEGETVQGRNLVVQRVRGAVPQSCRVVYISGSIKDARPALSSFSRGVLTIGEGENFIRQGGMIGFVIENQRVRFDINHRVAEMNGLKVSSRLLRVARSSLR